MKVLLIGVGAAGNKAVLDSVSKGIMKLEDTVIVNSTTKDFPKDYLGKKIVLSSGDTGSGKERKIAKEYVMNAMSDGKFTDLADGYTTVIIATSVEGGTGSGSTPTIAKFFKEVYAKNVHIIAFTGFEDDIRGLSNTVEFFKEISSDIVVQTISNKSFMAAANSNKLKAEELANIAMADKISVLTGQDFIEGSQNIDDTDILKLSNTAGYMVVEKKYFNKPLETTDDYEKIIKSMIYNSSAVKVANPEAIRMGIILNVSENSKDAIDYTFDSLKKHYGYPFEFFTQVQYDEGKEYIAYIASGMKMPIDEIEAVYSRYKEQFDKMDKNADEFFSRMSGIELQDSGKDLYDMMREPVEKKSIDSFLKGIK